MISYLKSPSIDRPVFRSDDPRRTKCEHLRILGSKEHVVKTLRRGSLKIERILIDEYAEEVSAYIYNGIEFAEATQNVPKNVRPLIAYYAVLNFGKALVKLKTKRKTSFAKHGLTMGGGIESDVGSWTVEVKGGVFNEMNRCFGREFKIDDQISAKLLFGSQIPLRALNELVFGEVSRSIGLYDAGRSHEGVLSVLGTNVEQFRETRPIIGRHFDVADEIIHEQAIQITAKDLQTVNSLFYCLHFDSGNFLVEPGQVLRDGTLHLLKFHPLLVSFAVLFLLGSLVRYYPSMSSRIFWGDQQNLAQFLTEAVSASLNYVVETLFESLVGNEYRIIRYPAVIG